jgi:hypothetical protein
MPHKDQDERRRYHAQYRRDHPEKWDYQANKDRINEARRERYRKRRDGMPCGRTTHGMTHTAQYALWAGAKKRALAAGLPFSLLVTDVPEIPDVCPVLGIQIRHGDGRAAESSPSLDRIVPSLGYSAGNVRVISWRANRLRSDAKASELMLVALDAARLEGSHV